MITRCLDKALCTWIVSFAVFLAFGLSPRPAYADGTDPLTTATATDAVGSEGGTLSSVFTLTNTSSFPIVITSVTVNLGTISGDSSDAVNGVTLSGGCGVGTTLTGTPCTEMATFTTPSNADDTDADSGVQAAIVEFGYDIASIGEGYTASAPFTITVNDTPVLTPEPSSLLLIGSGVGVLLGGLRRRWPVKPF